MWERCRSAKILMQKHRMKLSKFPSYSAYREAQISKNLAKINVVAVSERELAVVANYVRRTLPSASFGICHGVRNGFEVKRLRKLLKLNVIGTEISPTATNFPNVIEWDFHEVKPEWIGKVDLIYSNSWDHSFDPDLLFSRWFQCLAPSGILFIQWTTAHVEVNQGSGDCFGATLPELVELLNEYGTVEKTVSINQWKIIGRGRLWAIARALVRRKPVSQIVLVIARKSRAQELMG